MGRSRGNRSVKMGATKQDDRSPAGNQDYEHIPKEFARCGRIWRMLTMDIVADSRPAIESRNLILGDPRSWERSFCF
jgi:hypothetical protein